MAQVFQKTYECLNCKQQIRIAKIDNLVPGQKKKWEKYELDGVTMHVCHKQQPVVSNDLSKEVAAINAQLLVLVTRIEKQFEKQLGQK